MYNVRVFRSAAPPAEEFFVADVPGTQHQVLAWSLVRLLDMLDPATEVETVPDLQLSNPGTAVTESGPSWPKAQPDARSGEFPKPRVPARTFDSEIPTRVSSGSRRAVRTVHGAESE